MISPTPLLDAAGRMSLRQTAIPPTAGYVGRFAPSPTGPLHLGSLVAAMASYLDARAHQGRWLLRIEDVDPVRSSRAATHAILSTLKAFGFVWDGEVVFQSDRSALYEDAFESLRARGLVYPCTCSRREVADSAVAGVDGAPVYPGTCRTRLPDSGRRAAWRVRVGTAAIGYCDRLRGEQAQELARAVGDFIVRRADGVWAYQLAVVLDDALAGITDVVRGADLMDSTARQIHLQRQLGLPQPRYLHVAVVTDANGHKLSKQTGAAALAEDHRLASLALAAHHLGLGEIRASSAAHFWECAVPRWAARHALPKAQSLSQPSPTEGASTARAAAAIDPSKGAR